MSICVRLITIATFVIGLQINLAPALGTVINHSGQTEKTSPAIEALPQPQSLAQTKQYVPPPPNPDKPNPGQGGSQGGGPR